LLSKYHLSAISLGLALLTLLTHSAFAQNPRVPGQVTGPYTPLSNTDKLKYRIYEIVEPKGLFLISLGVGYEQLDHTPREWGQGVEGYARRYASTLGSALIEETMSGGLESVLHEDPRYFPLDGPSKKARLWNALKQTFVTRTDAGNSTFAYGHVGSAFAAGQITRLWMPGSSNSAADGVRTTGISLGVDAAIYLLYEFVPATRPR
jgi:hypothetical protein